MDSSNPFVSEATIPSTATNGSHKDGLTLRQVASQACKYIDIGAAVLPQPLFTPDVQDYGGDDALVDVVSSMETPYSRTLRQEFNAVVVEHHLKWSPLLSPNIDAYGGSSDKAPEIKLGCYDFTQADSVVDWAIKHGLKVKGHVLVWHVTSPTKLLQELTPDQVRDELRRHIFTVMGHFRDRIKVWDVVNEALAPDGSIAHNFFHKMLGPSYIEDSFRWAHEADPTAILLYNDNKVEGIGSKKAEGFYRLLSDLKARGVPIHGCGMQAHWNAAGVGRNLVPAPRQLKEQIRRIGDLGLTVNLSEMDVRVSQLENPELRPLAQTQIYHDLVAAAISEPACDGIWLWGFSDRHTWVTHFYYDDEPLIMDENYSRKQSYFGLREALVTLMPQGSVGGNVPLDKDVDHEGNHWGHPWRKVEGELRHGMVVHEDDGLMKNSDIPDWEVPHQSTEEADDEKRRSRLDSMATEDSADDNSVDENQGPIEFRAPETEIS
eukprot:CAMPEP_0198149574 /NCGR_PEP_ID=MMETSP1443-20131203/47236_1 /TAXON_ID=186043 /ORGANISM="Entomoneis sp., Strain CCMP2396" /LENGTH=490 /DNA_ID=CAMNT_0043814657 /DNA_START=53 /DNA_END=1525 /DNA_ORIENTATION=-